jgi:ribosome-binding protein aMBF1 (putative translation factor)
MTGSRTDDCPEVVLTENLAVWEACYLARKRKGLSEKRLAEVMGISHVMLRRLERGKGDVQALVDWWSYHGWPTGGEG